jgi:hypothetical protein
LNSFRTNIESPEFPFSISHGQKVTVLGSCFAENMGSLMQASKLDVRVNPFGILFNPFSIMNALERMLNNRPYSLDELVSIGDHYASLDHHGRFNKGEAEETLEGINAELKLGADHLRSSKVVFITLGSAWVYVHKDRNHTVANGHKIPNKDFEKRLLDFQDVHLILRHIPQFFASKKMDAQIVFTVSPVRHWKDGATQNQRSKSILNAAIHEVVDEFDNCHYFPSYEFMMDDLRDYRFYGTDMLHPSPQAIEYIWEKFETSFFSNETRIICQEVKSVVQAAEHRPMDPESNSFQRFIKNQIDLINGLEAKHPKLDLSLERGRFEAYQM